MDIRQLRTFIHIAELRSYTRAASFLRISQPALSRQIRMLEEELGTTLFHRHGHGVTLTPDGAILFEKSRDIMSAIDSMRAGFGNRGDGVTGSVSVGVSQGVSPMLAHPFLADCRTRFPNISLHLVEGYSGLLHEWLLSGSIEIAVLYGLSEMKTITRKPVLTEDLFAIGSYSPANIAREHFVPAELNDQTLILPRAPHVIRELTREAGIVGASVIPADALAVMVELAALGQGYTVLPLNAVIRDLEMKRLIAIPVLNPALSWIVSICHSNLRPLSPAAVVIAELIEEEMRRSVKDGRWKGRLL